MTRAKIIQEVRQTRFEKLYETRKLWEVRTWYNHDRLHDRLQERTPAEVLAGINVFAAKPG